MIEVDVDRTWWILESDEAIALLETDPKRGLDATQVELRRQRFGSNELEREPARSPWLIFGAQFANTMIVVLAVAGAITAALGEVKDAVVIAAIVVLNAAIGFVQEFRAERAMSALRDMTAPTARVVREGRQITVPAPELVPGDLVVLEAGDVVPADLRLLEAPNLRVNEAALTGESLPVDKQSGALAAGELVAERTNLAFKGTAVVYGRGRGVVVASGMATELGRIAALLGQQRSPATPLQRRLAVLGRRLAAAALVVCVVVFAAGVLRGEDVSLMFLTAVSLAVAAIPEALPAVVTISLALGAQRMASAHALIRRLPAVETLGSVTVICTDKTGTLTEAKMLVERIWTLAGELELTGSGFEPSGQVRAGDLPHLPEPETAAARLLTVAVLCNDAALIAPSDGGDWSVAGDPTEGALLAAAAKGGLDPENLRRTHSRIEELPFDSARRRMTTFHQAPGGELAACKGAVESVLDTVSTVAAPDGERPLVGVRDLVLGQADAYSQAGYRVLALAGRLIPASEPQDRAEQGLVLYGLAAMADPPRPAAQRAVEACRRAGITPVMITGDHPATAAAIARRLGVLDHEEVVTGATLVEEHARGLADHVERVAVYARTSPEQKLDIVQAWKSRGAIVAMTGDGVNDAPALLAADIGVAMGAVGTEVAKEASDLVLTDDDFATVVTAVGEGRRIYDNIRRFVRYTLTSNTGEIWVMLLGPFVGLPLPLLPVHILWINLVTDGLPGLALGVEKAEPDGMRRPPRPPAESIFARGMWQHVLGVGLLMGMIPLALGIWGSATDRPWQTMIFTSLAALQLGNALAVRSERHSIRSLGFATNRPLLATVVFTLALQLAVVYWPTAQGLLTTEALSALELGVVLVASTAVFWVVELEKAIRRRFRSRPGTEGPGG